MRKYLLCLLLLPLLLQAQQPKRELRGVWISTVQRIDWPEKDLDKREQQQDFIFLIDALRKVGINAVFIQIRPASDAFYRSKREPWSEWLMGEQGKKPGYDPLKFMLEACHARGIEVHAWFNPFRAVLDVKEEKLSKKHIANRKPEWIIQYGKGKVLDPGLPQVRQYVAETVLDVVKRYDIDGVHFDDYFYPYPVNSAPFPDQATYKRYGSAYSNIGDWRRANINLLIQTISANIKDIAPRVKFGISPFGVWRNQQSDPTGSDTYASIPSYDSIYADTRLWLKQGWIDYVVPQIYWSMDFKPAAYSKLLPWWAENSFGRHLYIGHAVYKIRNNADKSWEDPEELPRQLRMMREYMPKTHGSVFFRAGFLEKDLVGIKDRIKQEFYPTIALPPAMPWKDAIPPLPPVAFSMSEESYGTKLFWKRPAKASDGEMPAYYAIYRAPQGRPLRPDDPSQLIAIVPGHKRYFFDAGAKGHRYCVSSLDRLWNEAIPPIK